MTERATRDHCIRCGECCMGSSPTLQMADVSLVHDGLIEKKALYTVRAGELVMDNINGRLVATDTEFIKVREKEGGRACCFYEKDTRACGIYESRPIQCRALACWDETEFMKVYARPKLARRDIVRDPGLLKLMKAHDETCDYGKLGRRVKAIPEDGDAAVEAVLKLLKFDHDLRTLAERKLGMDPREMDFFFGRSLTATIPMFGLRVVEKPDGTFFLTVADPQRETEASGSCGPAGERPRKE